jgi:hypothetical protein
MVWMRFQVGPRQTTAVSLTTPANAPSWARCVCRLLRSVCTEHRSGIVTRDNSETGDCRLPSGLPPLPHSNEIIPNCAVRVRACPITLTIQFGLSSVTGTAHFSGSVKGRVYWETGNPRQLLIYIAIINCVGIVSLRLRNRLSSITC